MGRVIDITGMKFNKLTVIRRYEFNNSQNKPLWVCICDCENTEEIIVTGSSLKNGGTKSCGCLKTQHIKSLGKSSAKNLMSLKFGRLFVVKKVGSTKNRRVVWLCKCDCGNEIEIESSSLLSGATKSCGCLRREIISFNNKNNKKLNIYDFDEFNNIIIGYTSNTNNQFIIDYEDFNLIKNYTWMEIDGYIRSKIDNKIVSLHRLIMNVKDSNITVDHIYHNTYDNRKGMLRIATMQEQTRNQGIQSNNTSGVTGVSWKSSVSKWQSSICVNGKTMYLGIYSDIKEATKVRKKAEEKYFGEFQFKTF